MSMSLKGPAFHEYLSFTSQIAKLECSRLSESKDIKLQRRWSIYIWFFVFNLSLCELLLVELRENSQNIFEHILTLHDMKRGLSYRNSLTLDHISKPVFYLSKLWQWELATYRTWLINLFGLSLEFPFFFSNYDGIFFKKKLPIFSLIFF